MRKVLWIFLFISLLPTLFTSSIESSSNYVLPYPSFMPGSSFYKIHLIVEEINKYWHFGSFGQFQYNLQQSDKYLVEAKTLFEYKQYLLGYTALQKSDMYFDSARNNLIAAKKKNKNITQKQNVFNEASLKHIEVLTELLKEIPEVFIWQPEKETPITLKLKSDIEKSIQIRKVRL